MLRLPLLSLSSRRARSAVRTRSSRAGFTLIELMVVIAIIALMATMAFNGIQNAKKQAMKLKCSQQMKDIVTSMQAYEIDKQSFPGYRNVLLMRNGASYVDPQHPEIAGVSWAVMMFPYQDMQRQYDAYMTPPGGNNNNNQGQQQQQIGPVFDASAGKTRVENYICPADPPTISGMLTLAYIVNTGCRDAAGTPGNANRQGIPRDWAANGVCFDRFTGNPLASRKAGGAAPPTANQIPLVSQSASWIASHDGTSTTILLSENVDHGQFTDVYEQALGAIWDIQSTVQGSSTIVPGAPPPTATPNVPSYRINYNKGQSVAAFSGSPFAANTTYEYTRPSSMHAGGANIVYCDGHVGFLSEQMEYFVYCLLMSPDGKNVRIPGQTAALNHTWFNYPVNEDWVRPQ